MQMEQKKDEKQLLFLYDWMKIARKPGQSLRADIKMIFDLICIPATESEIKVIQKSIDPHNQKTELSKEDLLNCFIIDEDSKKQKEKQIIKAFKYISNDQQDVSFQQLRKYFQEEQIDPKTTDMILKQLSEFQNQQNGKFDYKKFANSIY